MTTLTKISQADLENLNAYLDNALSHKEKAEFEVKLAKSLPLQSELREYTILRNTLRSLPPKKAPHHFTLTTAEAQATKRPLFIAPIFSFAALVSAMLLAIVFASDWIFQNMSAPAVSVAMEAPLSARVTEPTEEIMLSAKSSTEAPLIFNWDYGMNTAYGMGGGAEGKGGGPESASAYLGDSRVINPGGVSETTPPELAAGTGMPEEPVTEPVEVPSPTLLSTFMVPADYAGAIIWGLQPECEGEIIEIYPSATDETQPVEEATQYDNTTQAQEETQLVDAPYQTAAWIKYSLAGLALLFGLLAFYFQRRMN